MIMPVITEKWTKELVQAHAQTAVKVELYTLPFYLTALTSIQEPSTYAYKSLLSICIEEMLHLQLAANLCLALDTQPEFTAPQYDGTAIPFLDPKNPDTGHYKLINAKLDALNAETLDLMLDIETPSGLEPHRHPAKGISKIIDWEEASAEKIWQFSHHSTPVYPYDTIGEMYDALIAGIHHVGIDQFSWDDEKKSQNRNQQVIWDQEKESFKQQITSYEDAQDAVKTISYQGEGTTTGEDRYAVPPHYRLEAESDDAHGLNEYSHYERLLEIKQQGLPKIYATNNQLENQQAQAVALEELQSNFANLLNELNSIWAGHSKNLDDFWATMTDRENGTIVKARNCWKAGVIPKWS
ncbi:ferritin-like domain-containing protein [Nostoc sp. TCL26-01]|uniref:ferritin-like domain-containing protein n=1 Tax=Nostoc sp. TCL26-01 TaxID=2576904 RepID=UPI0015C08681|nr:ferritin-like domain-containing protein [Nostoc sp. TCL26-01]QLE57765.1 hypothetical protein FD725_20950 [Nostoc sp. TCL26-01]